MHALTDIKVSQVAIDQATQSGFKGDVENRLRHLAAAGVRTDHQLGNVVFGPYVLLLTGGVIRSFTMIGPRIVDERPVSECQLCRGLMMIVVDKTFGKVQGRVAHPCPRATDTSKPLCDTLTEKWPR